MNPSCSTSRKPASTKGQKKGPSTRNSKSKKGKEKTSVAAEEESLTLQGEDLAAYLAFQNAQKTKTSQAKQKESAQVQYLSLLHIVQLDSTRLHQTHWIPPD